MPVAIIFARIIKQASTGPASGPSSLVTRAVTTVTADALEVDG